MLVHKNQNCTYSSVIQTCLQQYIALKANFNVSLQNALEGQTKLRCRSLATVAALAERPDSSGWRSAVPAADPLFASADAPSPRPPIAPGPGSDRRSAWQRPESHGPCRQLCEKEINFSTLH
jgi:hypothetical protein